MCQNYMIKEIYSYKPVLPELVDASSKTDEMYKFVYPNLDAIGTLYMGTGFQNTQQGEKAHTVALRGSTAALLPENGKLTFRHKKSDADMLSISDNANRIGAGYLFYHALLPEEGIKRDVDILFFTPERLAGEQRSKYHSFLTTKLVQPGCPIIKPEEYDRYKTDAMATLILRGIARRDILRLTPSGAARLVLEEDLYAEPWRWTSLKTYYVESPQRDRQRRQLLHYSYNALNTLVKNGIARKEDVVGEDVEPIFGIDKLDGLTFCHPRLDRLLTSYNFIYDQLSLLLFSRQSFSSEKAVRALMKWRSLMMNPALSYNADIIFKNKDGNDI